MPLLFLSNRSWHFTGKCVITLYIVSTVDSCLLMSEGTVVSPPKYVFAWQSLSMVPVCASQLISTLGKGVCVRCVLSSIALFLSLILCLHDPFYRVNVSLPVLYWLNPPTHNSVVVVVGYLPVSCFLSLSSNACSYCSLMRPTANNTRRERRDETASMQTYQCTIMCVRCITQRCIRTGKSHSERFWVKEQW